MGERGQKAYDLFLSGYNCTQSVVLAFADMLAPLDTKTLAMLSSGFGGGMGRMREVCGTVSGMFIVAGLLNGYHAPNDTEEKKRTYAMIQALANDFKQQHGSIICKELLGLTKPEGTYIPEERTAEYYKKRPCPRLAGNAADILARYLENNTDIAAE